jgi:hypothetical protein
LLIWIRFCKSCVYPPGNSCLEIIYSEIKSKCFGSTFCNEWNKEYVSLYMYIHYNIYPYHIKTESSQALFKYKASGSNPTVHPFRSTWVQPWFIGGFTFGKKENNNFVAGCVSCHQVLLYVHVWIVSEHN